MNRARRNERQLDPSFPIKPSRRSRWAGFSSPIRSKVATQIPPVTKRVAAGMKGSAFYFSIAFVLVFLLIDSYAAEGPPTGLSVPSDKNDTAADLNSTSGPPPDAIEGDREKKPEEQGGGSQDETRKGSDNGNLKESPSGKEDKQVKESQTQGSPSEKKDEPLLKPKPEETPSDKLDKPSVESKPDDGSSKIKDKNSVKSKPNDSPNENKDKPSMESKPRDNNEEGKLDEGLDFKTLPGGCDSSNRCIDKKNKFIACLRVPGQDSLSLSLLIQNKGKGLLTVNVEAPDFIKLEQTTVQLQAEKDMEVKVSVNDGAKDTVIVLKAGDGQCSLNLRNMIPDLNKKNEFSTSSGFTSVTRTSATYMLLAAAVLIAAVWLCLRFQRKNHQESGPRYEKVEMVLPVSTGGKKEMDEADGWDNSWGNGWDDEEAPVTPSKPVSTPSSKGLASRRFNKDGWKD